MILVKLSRLFLLPIAVTVLASSGAIATGGGFHPLLSNDSRNCYMDAMNDASHSKYQPALAKLESLLMLNSVSVGIDASTMPENYATFSNGVNKGIGIWKNALPDSPYVRSAPGQKPTVLIKFVKDINSEGGDLQGMIEAEHEFKWSGSGHTSKLISTMYVVYRTDDRDLTESEVAEVVAHELGHLLGLTDAYEARGLMGPFIAGEPRLAPSASELQAVHQFRDMIRAEIAKIEDRI